jgi:tRNA U34 5-methylaminomethyl-2-thiouridine-forming methyltransferase MnmC
MEKTDLVDQLIIRLEELQEIMQIIDDNVAIDNVLLQSIVNHANETTLNAVIGDVERMIIMKDKEAYDDNFDYQ